jgi:hypothetical protein
MDTSQSGAMELRSTTLPGTQELELRNWNSGLRVLPGTQELELRNWNSGLGFAWNSGTGTQELELRNWNSGLMVLPGTQELELRNWNSGTGTQELELRSRVCLELMGPAAVLPWNSGLGVSRAVSHTLWLSIGCLTTL